MSGDCTATTETGGKTIQCTKKRHSAEENHLGYNNGYEVIWSEVVLRPRTRTEES